MKRSVLSLACLLVLAAWGAASEPAGKLLREVWYESRAQGGKLGYLHLQAHETERDGQKLIRTVIRDHVSYLRSGDPYSDSQEEETLETPEGKVVELAYSITLSKSQRLRVRGRIENDRLVLQALDADGQPTRFAQTLPWDPEALGLFAVDGFFEKHKPTPGRSYVLKQFSVVANQVVPVTYAIQGTERHEVAGAEQELVRVQVSYPKWAYLTPATIWLDGSGRVVRMEEEDQSLFGRMSRELCDRERAEAVFEPSVRDREAPIRVDKPIRVRRGWPGELRLRIRRPGDDEPATLFAEDGRQRIVCADQKAVELLLRDRPPLIPVKVQQALLGWVPVAEAEFLESNFFIRCDDPLVQKQAQAALGAEGEKLSPLEKAKRIRRWIRRNIRPNYEIAFATADEVARCRQGDCTEMGILAAAMARAVGVPSRVVFGLVYDADNHGFGGHLWTEVFADGQWHPLDATGVIDTVGAAYIKIAAYSLKDVLNPDALVAIRRAFTGPLDVEVLEAR